MHGGSVNSDAITLCSPTYISAAPAPGTCNSSGVCFATEEEATALAVQARVDELMGTIAFYGLCQQQRRHQLTRQAEAEILGDDAPGWTAGEWFGAIFLPGQELLNMAY